MRRATGLMAGPLRPPMSLDRTGRLRRQSTAIPLMVLIRLTASAPASAAAAAMGTMSLTFGVSLAMIGKGQALFTRRTSRPTAPASTPRSRPWLTLGQEDVELDGRQTGVLPEQLRHRDELVLVFAGDVGDDRRA